MSAELTLERFPEFFQALTGHEPFRWQQRLMERVVDTGWPETLDLPTASGKTACLEIAVFHLALQADAGSGRTAARRVFFVVDRRIVVDQAFERAEHIAAMMADPGDTGVLAIVAGRLQQLAGPGAVPLGHERLRGGMRRENVWTRSPAQPAIITSTVDQIGSRLLFRSYDSSRFSAPVEAGLVGNDSLILLDEAHCAVPFQQTARAIRRYRQWGDDPFDTPWAMVSLSATPDISGDEDTFRLEAAEREDPALRQRILARKPAALVVARGAKVPRGGGRGEKKEARARLGDRIADQLLAFSASGLPQRTAVIVNRVATAVCVRERLAFAFADNGQPADVVLMTGRMRPLDRDDLVARWSPRLKAGVDTSDQERPVVVVSTQSLEVGADFDFDLLITEAASLDALRQRFGRLDRLGRREGARGVIVIGAYQQNNSDDDPVYGAALSRTWQALTELADADHELDADWPGIKKAEFHGVVDLGIEGLDAQLEESPEAELNAPTERAPVLLPAHLDRLVQTDPLPRPTPEPAFFLHGRPQAEPEVRVLWRLDLADHQALAETLSLCPPSSVEAIPASLGWIRAWLRTPDADIPEDDADVEGRSRPRDGGRAAASGTRSVVVWRGGDDAFSTTDPDDIRAGDFVIIPGPHPGPFAGTLQWEEGSPMRLDQGDRAQWEARRRPTLRLHGALIDAWPEEVVPNDLKDEAATFLGRPAEAIEPSEVRSFLQRLRDSMDPTAAERQTFAWLPDAIDHLASGPFAIAPYPHAEAEPPPGVIVSATAVAADTDPVARAALEEVGDEDELDRRSESPRTVALDDHLDHVTRMAEEFARRCGLPDELTAAVRNAARLHDVGKADSRFQAVLYGDGLPTASNTRQALAKSNSFPKSWAAYRRLAEASGLPRGFRHELVSVRMAEAALSETISPDVRELVEHLIASHHGRCRPFAPVVIDDAPVQVRYESSGLVVEADTPTGLDRLDSGVADRFWRLVRRYGWWGLAYLEAVLRTADRFTSALEAANRTVNVPEDT